MFHMSMQITLISGSAQENSRTLALLNHIKGLLEKRDVQVVIWDLYERPLPIVMPEYHDNPIETPDKTVQEFNLLVQNSDAIVLGTPLYHGSYSGILKNALDNLGADAFKNKPVGLVSVAGGMPSVQALEHLRSVVRTLYGYGLQTQIGTSKEDYVFLNTTLAVKNPEVKQRSMRFVEELFVLTSLLIHKKRFTQI